MTIKTERGLLDKDCPMESPPKEFGFFVIFVLILVIVIFFTG